MSSYLFPTRLDKWVSILRQLRTDRLGPLASGKSGGTHLRVKELIQGGLVRVCYGRNGGYQLAFPLSEIQLGSLLDIFPRERCPTLNLFYRYAGQSIEDILQWQEIPKGRYRASIESVSEILRHLNTVHPTFPEELADIDYSIGYVEQVLASLVPINLVKNVNRKGKILVKPFEEITVGDIAPVLAHRGRIHSTIVYLSTDVKLIDIQ